MTSTFKNGTGGCDDWSAFPGILGRVGHNGVFFFYFCLILK